MLLKAHVAELNCYLCVTWILLKGIPLEPQDGSEQMAVAAAGIYFFFFSPNVNALKKTAKG